MKMDKSDKNDLIELLVVWCHGYDLRELDDVVKQVKTRMALDAAMVRIMSHADPQTHVLSLGGEPSTAA